MATSRPNEARTPALILFDSYFWLNLFLFKILFIGLLALFKSLAFAGSGHRILAPEYWPSNSSIRILEMQNFPAFFGFIKESPIGQVDSGELESGLISDLFIDSK